MSFNRTIILGNLTRDPELRYTPKGTAIAQVTLAVNRTWKNEAGEQQEEVSFVDCEAWGRTGEVIAQYMRKGKPLLVEGRLKQESWEDKQSHQKRSKLKVVVESFSFVGGKDGAASETEPAPPRPAPTAPARQQVQQGAAAGNEYPGSPIEDSDVPF